MDNRLELKHVSKCFGEVEALRDINFQLAEMRSWACWATTAQENPR